MKLLDEARDRIFVSAASVLEIAIKHALRRGESSFPISASEALQAFASAGFDFLPVTPAHAAAVETLPNHHADPFDRLLVAQALNEPMRLLTAGRNVAHYSDIAILV